MVKFPILDKNFLQCGPSIGTAYLGTQSQNMQWLDWYKTRECADGGVVFFSDQCIGEVENEEFSNMTRVAILIEPRVILDHCYHKFMRLKHKFHYVLSHDNEILNLPNSVYIPTSCGSWVRETDMAIHNKLADVSIIASSKNQTTGHKLRHEVIKRYSPLIDGVFGRGINPIPEKIEGLRDFRYHITIENCNNESYFTEKLIDSFLTGCVPIYWGSKKPDSIFNTNGIIRFETADELERILKEIATEDYYNSLMNSGVQEDNFEIAKNYIFPEDRIYEDFIISKLGMINLM
jgi:hypothetical protein